MSSRRRWVKRESKRPASVDTAPARCRNGLPENVSLAEEIVGLSKAFLIAPELREKREIEGTRLEVVRDDGGKVSGSLGKGFLGRPIAAGKAGCVANPAPGGGEETRPDRGRMECRVDLLECEDC